MLFYGDDDYDDSGDHGGVGDVGDDNDDGVVCVLEHKTFKETAAEQLRLIKGSPRLILKHRKLAELDNSKLGSTQQ